MEKRTGPEGVKLDFAFRNPDRKKSTREHVAELSEVSRIEISESEDCTVIELHGPIAILPSMKNSNPKPWVKNPHFEQKVGALQSCLGSAQPHGMFPDKVWIMVTLGKGNRIDENAALTFICDWLEPPTKRVGRGRNQQDRGWGAGIISDDKFAKGTAIYAADLGMDDSCTRIIVTPWTEQRANLVHVWCATLTGGKLNFSYGRDTEEVCLHGLRSVSGEKCEILQTAYDTGAKAITPKQSETTATEDVRRSEVAQITLDEAAEKSNLREVSNSSEPPRSPHKTSEGISKSVFRDREPRGSVWGVPQCNKRQRAAWENDGKTENKD